VCLSLLCCALRMATVHKRLLRSQVCCVRRFSSDSLIYSKAFRYRISMSRSTCAKRGDTQTREPTWGTAKNYVIFPIASLCWPKTVAWRRSEHFYGRNKVNRINGVGTALENIAFDNVCFQASRPKTVPQRSPSITQTFFSESLNISIH